MAMSKSANNYNRQNWEESDFPILCQTCLGDNPYIRMTKERHGKECKTCARPFTVFRWCPGARMRFKKTEVCQTCSKMKNICQTCLLDLEYGLPVQVRDAALKIIDDMPKSDVGKEFYQQNIEREIADSDGTVAVGLVGKAQAPSDMLAKLARTTPYYKRNRPHICSFWVKGECKRGEECPYRHEHPTDPSDPLSTQNIKDRFFGINDPVAEKLLSRYNSLPKLDSPDDRSVTTLYVGNLGGDISESDLRDHFYQYGEIRTITMAGRQQCAFIQYTTRAGAESAAEMSYNKLILKGRRLNVKWGKSQGGGGGGGGAAPVKSAAFDGAQLKPVPGLPGALPAAPDFFNLAEVDKDKEMLYPPLLPPPSDMSRMNRPPMGGGHHHMRMPPFPPPPGMMMGPPRMPMFMRPGMGPRGPPPPGFYPEMRPLPPLYGRPPFMPPPPMPAGIHYPSQDPSRMGSTQAPGSKDE